MIAARRHHVGRADLSIEWLPSEPDVLAFRRGDIACVVNLSPDATCDTARRATIVASGPRTTDGALPPDTAVWIELDDIR